MSSKCFGLDGKEWTRESHIPPIVQIEEKTGEYEAGWYHCDEVEQIIGPFATFDEAVTAFKEYCKTL